MAGDRWQEHDLIFPTSIGTPKDPHNLLKSFKRLLVRDGLPQMRFHDLHHTSITLLLNEVWVPIKEAQRRAGHASTSTKIKIYRGETTSKMDEIDAQSLDDLITPVAVELRPNCTKKRACIPCGLSITISGGCDAPPPPYVGDRPGTCLSWTDRPGNPEPID